MAERTTPKKATRPASGKKVRKRRSRGRRITVATLKTLLIVMCLGLIAGTGVAVYGYQTTDLPDPNADFQTQTSFVYYNDGKSQLGSFAVQNRTPIDYDKMPQSIKDAVVAAENRTFFEDKGISIRGIVRSVITIARGGELQGGSTITQQYIKILYLQSERTLARKYKELFLAIKLSREVPKEKVLEGYLNTIYFGRGAYGIQAASKAYFNTDASKLTVPQAAVLASVLNNPNLFDPSEDASNAARLLDRYRYVIDGMADAGAISAADQAEYRTALPEFPDVPINSRFGGPKGFLLKMVSDELAAEGFSAQDINGGGLRVTTTFDKTAQAAAVEAAQKNTSQAAIAADQKASNLHAAVASIDNETGGVLALYGGPDFVKNGRNWATTPRSTASTFKAFALAAGLKDGFSLYSTFQGNTFTPPGDTETVRNENRYQYGRVNLIKATADSINTAFVDMTTQMDDGPAKVADMAVAAGAPRRDDDGWYEGSRIALGTAEVSPLDQAAAYSTFARDGESIARHVVAKVTDADGKTLYTADPETKRVIDSDVSRDVTYALSDVVEEGTGRSVQTVNRPVAGKTGTAGIADDIVSAWFVAYTKQMTTAVMYVAGDAGTGDLDPYARPGDSTFFGGTYPAQTWADYTSAASEGMPVETFDPPAYVNRDKAPSRPPQTQAPTTQAPTTQAPTTQAPTTQPPSSAPPSSQPPASSQPPTSQPPTSQPPSSQAPPSSPPSTRPPATSQAPSVNPPSGSSSGQGDGGGG